MSLTFRSWAPVVAGGVAVAALMLLLELTIKVGLISGFVVSPPSAVGASLSSLFHEESLIVAFLRTFAGTFVASALAAVVGIPLGYLLFRYRLFGGAYEAWIAALFSAPLVLLYPIFLVLLGRTALVGIAMAFIVGLIPVALKTREGLSGVPPVLINVARAFGAGDREILHKVLLPAARPAIFTGLRLCLIYAMINVVSIEYLANLSGLGFLVGEMYDRYDIPGMYAAIVCLVVTSALFYTVTGQAERWFGRR